MPSAFKLFLLLLAFALMAPWMCYKGCPESFQTEMQLRLHQNRCRFVTTGQASIAQKRKRLADERVAAAKLRQDQELEAQRKALREAEAAQSHNNDFAEGSHQVSQDANKPTGRVPRIRRLPRALRDSDFLPHGLSQLPQVFQTLAPPPPSQLQAVVNPSSTIPDPNPPVTKASTGEFRLPDPVYTHSEPNGFGLFRSYLTVPHVDPEADLSLDDMCNCSSFAVAPPEKRPWWSGFGRSLAQRAQDNIFSPFMNATIFRLMSWFYSGSNAKSIGELDRLVHDVLLAEDFDQEHLRGFSAAREAHRLDEWEDVEESPFSAADGWQETSINIPVPAEGVKHTSEQHAPTFTINGVFHRSLTEIIRTTFQSTAAMKFHLIPFRLFGLPKASTAASASSSSTSTGSTGASIPPDGPGLSAGATDSTQPSVSPGFSGEDVERVYSELYNSDAMVEEYERINRDHPLGEPHGPAVENVIAAMMFWSDSTHLASFGTASLWPIYLFFGNQTKYTRSKPSEFAAQHVAYLPSLPDTFQDWYQETYHKAPTADVLTHCKRELMQAVWRSILNDEFLHAYEHGLIIKFADGVVRRVFSRIFTYSADYPEKMLLATLRFLANSPCPRCLTLKKEIVALGTKADARRRLNVRVDDASRRTILERCRDWIYTKGHRIRSKFVETWLHASSWVPTRNAFSDRLHKFGVNFYDFFAPDLLHEFELGVWKGTFTHLLRVLFAAGGDRVQTLNTRFRLVPTFGRDTIRRFARNTADMKKLAARDFEDILQCSIPVFENLLDEPYNAIVLDLLWSLAVWHATAKLRMHTTSTVRFLDQATTVLGQQLRRFKSDLCDNFATRELPRETAARGRRNAALAGKGNSASRGRGRGNGRGRGRGRSQPTESGSGEPESTMAGVSKVKIFNLTTYKLHALGDYVKYILRFGTSDNYSTQTGELEHRRVKRFYARTNKWRFVRQITKHQRREELLRRLSKKTKKRARISDDQSISAGPVAGHRGAKRMDRGTDVITLPFHLQDPLVAAPPAQHYQVSTATRYPVDITSWLADNRTDRALQDFLPRLKDHMLARLSHQEYHGDLPFSDEDRRSISIVNNRMYSHKVLRVNYTSYDMRRCQDSMNPRTHADVMVLAHEEDQPVPGGPRSDDQSHRYWYARILGIFHAVVIKTGAGTNSQPQKIDFLWVRWYGRDPSHKSGFKRRRYPRIGFVDSEDMDAFGFLDPQDVIRGVHLIPGFAHGTTPDLLGPSIARQPQENDEDWQYYYVNIFVDRDMFMRFLGGGIGHRATSIGLLPQFAVEPLGAIVPEDATTDEVQPPLPGNPISVDETETLLSTDNAEDEYGDQEEEPEASYESGEDDYGYEQSDRDSDHSSADSDSGAELDYADVDLGAEDGEEDHDMDEQLEDMEGYAPL